MEDLRWWTVLATLVSTGVGGCLSLYAVGRGLRGSRFQTALHILCMKSLCDGLLCLSHVGMSAAALALPHHVFTLRQPPCQAQALLLEFLLRASHMWLFLLALDLYWASSNPFSYSGHKLPLFHGLAWGFGLLTLILMLALNGHQTLPNSVCWLDTVQQRNLTGIQLLFELFPISLLCAVLASVLMLVRVALILRRTTYQMLPVRRRALARGLMYVGAFGSLGLVQLAACLAQVQLHWRARTDSAVATFSMIESGLTLLLCMADAYLIFVLVTDVRSAAARYQRLKHLAHSRSDELEATIDAATRPQRPLRSISERQPLLANGLMQDVDDGATDRMSTSSSGLLPLAGASVPADGAVDKDAIVQGDDGRYLTIHSSLRRDIMLCTLFGIMSTLNRRSESQTLGNRHVERERSARTEGAGSRRSSWGAGSPGLSSVSAVSPGGAGSARNDGGSLSRSGSLSTADKEGILPYRRNSGSISQDQNLQSALANVRRNFQQGTLPGEGQRHGRYGALAADSGERTSQSQPAIKSPLAQLQQPPFESAISDNASAFTYDLDDPLVAAQAGTDTSVAVDLDPLRYPPTSEQRSWWQRLFARRRQRHYEMVRQTVMLPPVFNRNLDFVDYERETFARLRQLHGISPQAYAQSLWGDHMNQQVREMTEHFGSSRSGSFFYFTHDRRFLVKTMTRREQELLLDILPEYEAHLTAHPSSVLCRICGLHSVRLSPEQSLITIMVQENVLIPQGIQAPVSITFDLKGSTVDRKTRGRLKIGDALRHDGDLFSGGWHVLKDMDLHAPFEIGAEAKASLKTQLVADTTFLHSQRIMDYSLVVGVHQCDGSCRHAAATAVESPFVDSPRRTRHSQRLRSGLPGTWDQKTCLFLVGIIDILQTFDSGKRLENRLKTKVLRKSTTGISAVHPDQYAERFVQMNMSKFV